MRQPQNLNEKPQRASVQNGEGRQSGQVVGRAAVRQPPQHSRLSPERTAFDGPRAPDYLKEVAHVIAANCKGTRRGRLLHRHCQQLRSRDNVVE